MYDAKRRLKVNLADLKDAFDSGFDTIWHYLDLETGDVVMVMEDEHQRLEELIETTDAETAEAVNEAINNEDLSNAEKEQLLNVAQVEFGYNTRFIEIPRADSRQGYEDMEAFIETLTSPHLRELLEVAIRGKGAFRRFKDVLYNYAEERERWFRFQDERLQQRVFRWLEMEGIDPIF